MTACTRTWLRCAPPAITSSSKRARSAAAPPGQGTEKAQDRPFGVPHDVIGKMKAHLEKVKVRPCNIRKEREHSLVISEGKERAIPCNIRMEREHSLETLEGKHNAKMKTHLGKVKVHLALA